MAWLLRTRVFARGRALYGTVVAQHIVKLTANAGCVDDLIL